MNGFIILMAALMSIIAISIDALLPALGLIRVDLNIENPNHAQYIIGFIFMGMTIGQLVYGPLSDAIGRKKTLYSGLGLYLVGSIVCYLSQSLQIMLIGRFIQGLGVASPYISTMSIIRDKYSGRDMARIMSLVMVIFMIVPSLAPSLGQAVLIFSSWRTVFLLYIILAIVLMTFIHFRLEETLAPENRIKFSIRNIIDGFKIVFRNRITMGYTICIGVIFGSLVGYLNSSQQIFQVHFATGKMFTVYFGLLALVFGASSLANSHFVKRLGMRHICIRSMICVIAVSAIFLVINYSIEVKLWMFMAYAACLFFCFGLMFGNLNSLAMEPMGHIAGMASAIIGSVSSLIDIALGVFIGQMYDDNLTPVIMGFLFTGIIAFAAMMWAEKGRVDF